MANMVLDVAQKFNCRRIYTSGAAIAITHHSLSSKVWAVANNPALYRNCAVMITPFLMSEVEGRGNQGSITGLNGLLIGTAKRRVSTESVWWAKFRIIYPESVSISKASKAVLDTLAKILGVNTKYNLLDDMIVQMEVVVGDVYQQFPQEIRERLETEKTRHAIKTGSHQRRRRTMA